jgi:pSer/pThr/pTyr-binding forkhead associated (FHA) protein
MAAALQQKPEIKIKLTVVKGPHAGQVFQLNKEVITLGRGSENHIVLMNDPQISRVHAQISIVDSEIEVSNLSQKNAVVVDGSSVQKWKLVNNSNFTIGDSEIKIQYDLGQAVVSVPTRQAPSSQSADVVPINKAKSNAVTATPPKPKPKVKKASPPNPTSQKQSSSNSPALRQQVPIRNNMQAPMVQGAQLPSQNMGPLMATNGGAAPQMAYDINAQYQGQQAIAKNDSLIANPSFKYFLIVIIAMTFGYAYMSKPDKKAQAKKIASTLKYEDEVGIRLASKKESELEEERDRLKKQKSSPQVLRVNENFIRGMRDFQLGNYTRAQENFQLVLNLDPDHALAKRHNYLAKVRFDELVQEKLMLGESYYKKHNFRMCNSMYTQVVNMLQGKNNDQKLLLAEKKAKECELASQGIR